MRGYSDAVLQACLDASASTLPSSGRASHHLLLPGWNEYVQPAREKSIFWHRVWVEGGRPHVGVVADIMRRTRAAYHYAVRRVKRDKVDIIKDRLANAIVGQSGRDFWREAKRLCGKSHNATSAVIDGDTGSTNIADRFADRYESVYTSVAYDRETS